MRRDGAAVVAAEPGATTSRPSSASDSRRPLTSLEQTVAGQLMAEATYQRLSQCLAAKNIEHLLLKGPHLGAIVYEQASARPYCDLDVLVRRRDFEAALLALEHDGFQADAGPAARAATHRDYYNRGLVSPHGIVVEVHRAFEAYGLYRVDYDALFERAVPFSFGKVKARGLSVEDLLLNLAIHAAKSLFRAIEAKHVKDVAMVVARQSVDWPVFIRRATDAGCRVPAWLLFSAAVNAYDAEVPEDVLRQLRPSLPRRQWLRVWLRWDGFPMDRGQQRPLWLLRIGVGPAVVDRLGPGAASGLRFAARRVEDAVRDLLSEQRAKR